MVGLPYPRWAAKLNEIKRTFAKDAFAPLVRKTADRALVELVARSPIGNPALWQGKAPAGYVPGQFVNDWHVSIGSMSPSTRNVPDASGSASLAEAKKFDTYRLDPFVITYIHNSLPYARRLEHGWSAQAPYGMVAITAASLRLVR